MREQKQKIELRTTHYTFWAHIEKESFTGSDDDYFILVGNIYAKGAPCIRITASKINNAFQIMIQDIQYNEKCAIATLMEKSKGTIEMIQGTLKAIVKLFPNIDTISLTDNSYYLMDGYDKKKNPIPIPETRLLLGKPTWYAEHFGALPSNPDIQCIIDKQYKEFRNKKIRDTFLYKYVGDEYTNMKIKDYLTKERIHTFIHDLFKYTYLHKVSGELWHIPIETIKKYPTKGKFVKVKEEKTKRRKKATNKTQKQWMIRGGFLRRIGQQRALQEFRRLYAGGCGENS